MHEVHVRQCAKVLSSTLVAGASKGIGAATALELASLGAKVAINYSSDSAAADAVVAKIGSGNAIAIKADVGNVQQIEWVVKETVGKWGKIDILVANAGVLQMKDLESTTEKDWDDTFRVNVKGPYFLAQVRLLRRCCISSKSSVLMSR